MAKSYRQPSTNASIGKGGAAPYNTPFSGVMQPICVPQDRKLLDQFRDKMRFASPLPSARSSVHLQV